MLSMVIARSPGKDAVALSVVRITSARGSGSPSVSSRPVSYTHLTLPTTPYV